MYVFLSFYWIADTTTRVVDSTGEQGKANHTTQLGVICQPAEGHSIPVCVIVEDIKQHWSQCRPLRDLLSLICQDIGSFDHCFPDANISPIPHPLHHPTPKSVPLQFRKGCCGQLCQSP